MLFSEIYGLSEVKESLIRAVKNNHVAHAQMFLGKDGSPNLAMALAYATFINCEDRQENDSCGKCPSCTKSAKLIHPDFHFVYPLFSVAKKDEDKSKADVTAAWRKTIITNPYIRLGDWAEIIDAGNKQCIISVTEGRGIIKNLTLKSFEAEYKVVFIWLPELMNQSAANSILKILEEPPAKTLFLLVSNDAEKNLATIISRTQMVKIPRYNDDELEALLVNKFFIPKNKALNAVRIAEGDAMEAIQAADELTDQTHIVFRDWMRLCFTNNFTELVNFSEDYQKFSKNEQKGLLLYGISTFRNLLIYHSNEASLLKVSEEVAKFLEGFAKVVGAEKIADLSEHLTDALHYIERNASPKITMMNLSIELAGVLKK